MTYFDYQTDQKPFSKSDEVIEDAPSLTPGLDEARKNVEARKQEEVKPDLDQWRLENVPGGPSDKVYDYYQAHQDGKLPKPHEDGESVSLLDPKYYKGGRSPSAQFHMEWDVTSKSYQPSHSGARMVTKTARDIIEATIQWSSGTPSGSIPVGRGLIEPALIGAGHLADLWADMTGKERKNNDVFVERVQQKLEEIESRPDLLPEAKTVDPETVQGMVEEIGSDVLTLLGSIGIGNKMLGVTKLDPIKATGWINKTMEAIKRTIKQERGVALGEIIYSKVGMSGNLSTFLKDIGIGGPITEYLDSTEFDSETEMAMKNVIEGVMISKLLQVAWASRKAFPEVYRYLKEYDAKMPGGPGMQKGMVGWHGSPHKMAPEPGNPLGKFRSDKIGTGEGFQAYGWGHYIGEAQYTGQHYQNVHLDQGQVTRSLMEKVGSVRAPMGVAVDAGNQLKNNNGNLLKTVEYLRTRAEEFRTPAGSGPVDDIDISNAQSYDNMADAIQKYADDGGESLDMTPGHLYEVDIPDEQIDKMLDWDAPFKDQPAAIQKALRGLATPDGNLDTMTREELISLAEKIDRNGDYSDEAAELEGWLPLTKDQLLTDVFGPDGSLGEDGLEEYLKAADFSPEQTGSGIYKQLVAQNTGNYEKKLEELLYPLMEKYNIPGDISPTQPLGNWAAEIIRDNGDKFSSQELNSVQALIDKNPERLASMQLGELGIPGIKYFDGTSRSAGEGTRNFVVFDENNLKILSRDGEKLPSELQKQATIEYKQAKKSDSLPDHPPYIPKGEKVVIPESQVKLPGPTSTRKGAADPRINNKLVSAVNLPKPLHEIEQGIKRVSKGEAVPEVIITPESLKGQNIMYVYGDKTLGDAQVTMVDGKKLRAPVDAEGGRIFMRTGTKDGNIWSSAKGIISRHMNAAQLAADANGEPVNIIYVAMGRTGMDFSHMPTDVHLQRIMDAKLSSGTVKAYDEIMAAKIPGWVGIKSPDIEDFINANPNRRKNFLEWSDKANVANLDGMPDVGTSRLAVTDPRLLNTPLDHGGLGVSRIDLTRSPTDTAHKTYKTDMPGQYVGDLLSSVPFEILFPTSFAYFKKAYPTTRVDYMAARKSLTEVADDAWVNRVSEYLEKMK